MPWSDHEHMHALMPRAQVLLCVLQHVKSWQVRARTRHLRRRREAIPNSAALLRISRAGGCAVVLLQRRIGALHGPPASAQHPPFPIGDLVREGMLVAPAASSIAPPSSIEEGPVHPVSCASWLTSMGVDERQGGASEPDDERGPGGGEQQEAHGDACQDVGELAVRLALARHDAADVLRQRPCPQDTPQSCMHPQDGRRAWKISWRSRSPM